MEVVLHFPWTGLLGNDRIEQCTNSTDPTCVKGAALSDAYRRYFSGNDTPALVLPLMEVSGAFVNLHPVGIPVNRVIYQGVLGYNKAFFSRASIVLQQDAKVLDLTALQSNDFQFLSSDIQVPATSTWKPFHAQIYYDQETRLAAMMFPYSGTSIQVDPLEVSKALLDQIARRNQEEGCTTPNEKIVEMERYLNRFQSADPATNSSDEEMSSSPKCWVSFMLFSFTTPNLQGIIQQLAMHSNPPAFIHNIVPPQPGGLPPPQLLPNKKTWVAYGATAVFIGHHHYQLTLFPDSPWIKNVTVFATQSMAPVPQEIQNDVIYQRHVSHIYELAQEAMAKNPLVGFTSNVGGGTTFNAITKQPVYPCYIRSCDPGNLVTDAFRYKAKADIAFLSGHFFYGSGWQEGPATLEDMYDAVSESFTLCTGMMTGVSLSRLFNYTLAVSSLFESDRNVLAGGNLLQVSGMRYVYNSEIAPSRLLSLEVWDQETQTYQPMERLRLYKVATNTYLCQQRLDISAMLGPEGLIIDGEQPFSPTPFPPQQIVAAMLSDLSSEANPYEVADPFRVVDDPTSEEPPLNWNQNQDDCEIGKTWVESKQTCQECPDTTGVQWSRELVEYDAVSQSSEMIMNREDLILLNGAPFPVVVKPKSSPSWLAITQSKKLSSISESNITSDDMDDIDVQSPITLATGERTVINYMLSSETLESGTAVGTVSYGVIDGGDFPGCEGKDASFEIRLRVTPQDELNQLGNIRWAGWALAFIVLSAACWCGSMVVSRRKDKVVRLMQPIFLVTICAGVSILGLSLITLGFDDEIVSTRAMDAFCMATPWLLAIGFSVAFSALFAKLWRINRLFHASHHRHMKVEAKDVALPLAVFFVLNFVVLMVWTFVDPLQWTRKAIDGEEWNTYGVCGSESAAGRTLQGVIIAINVAALVGASYQAYSARDLSQEFSESKSIGIALYSWVQLLIVAVPVLFLTNEDSVEARYFLQSGLVFAVCMTMLLCIFGPIIIRTNNLNDGASTYSGTPHGSVHISGLDAPGDAKSRSFGRHHSSNPGLSSSVHSYDSAASAPMESSLQNGPHDSDEHGENSRDNNISTTKNNGLGSTSVQQQSSDYLPESEHEVIMPTIVEGSKESMTSMYLDSSSSLKASLKVKADEKHSSDLRQSALVRIDETVQENGEGIDQEKSFEEEDGTDERFETEFQKNKVQGSEEVGTP